MAERMSLVDAIPADPSAESLYDAFTDWAAGQGLILYPHQEESAIELFCANNVVLATPTGSGKSLVAVAAHFAALAERKVTFYTAPIKALVSEVLRPLHDLRGGQRGVADRGRFGQRRRADHLLHGGGVGEHRAARGRGRGRRPGRDG